MSESRRSERERLPRHPVPAPTDFPMKAGLPEAEPKWLARWEETELYARIARAGQGRPLFILHDGPPYANGEIHSGTGLNKILKDFVVRSQGMLGKDAPYVPGWDCHGLPIEWKIEEKYRAEGKAKDDVPIDQLRRDCREFARLDRRAARAVQAAGLHGRVGSSLHHDEFRPKRRLRASCTSSWRMGCSIAASAR